MDARAALKNLAAWKAANDEVRVSVLVELATKLGAGWRAGRTRVGRHGLGELLRRDLGLSFVVVPGGWLRMGLSADDLFTAARARDAIAPAAVWGGGGSIARPTRWVRMRPYLLAIAGIPPAPGEATSDGGRASEAYRDAVDAARGDRDDGWSAAELVKAYEGGPPDAGAAEPAMRTIAIGELAGLVPEGFRLPSEAELEWALREGGTTRWIGVAGDVEVTAANRRKTLLGELANGFGLQGLRDLQNPCADGAVDYDVESPTDQRARATDRPERIARWAHTYWQDDDQELFSMLAGSRGTPDEYGDTILRLAADLPGLTEDVDGKEEAKAAGTGEAEAAAKEGGDEKAGDAGDKTEKAEKAGKAEGAEKADGAESQGREEQTAADEAAPAAATADATLDGPPGPLAEHELVLAALASANARRQTDAIAALAHLAIGPGHDVAPTAAAVVAALPRIAPAARAHVLTWLADVQVGGHQRLAAERPERKRRHELGLDRAAVRAAVAGDTGPIVAMLDDPHADVRSAAALALAFTVDAPAEAKAALGKRLAHESEPGVQAMLILACVRLGTGFRSPAPEPVIAGAIAIATAFDGPPNVEALTAATALGPTPHLAFAGGDLGKVAIAILRTLAPDVQAEAAAAIAGRALAEKDGALALVACEMAFGKPAQPAPPRLLEELSSSQRQVVARLADLDRSLDWLGFGLPPTVTARRRFLALDPAGPTDRFVAHGDGEVPLWFALRSRMATDGIDAAKAEAAKLLAGLPLADRLAVYLDRGAHALHDVFGTMSLDEVLAQATRDLTAARAAVDELVATPAATPRGNELLRAVAATRPGEELPETLLAELDGGQLGRDLDALKGFRPAAVARRLNAVIQPVLDRALATDGWQLGLDHDLAQWARVLAIAPSPSATRRLLLLGWASGQPASVREAIGKAASGQAALAPILADYDRLPQFASWQGARAAMKAYAE
ncbi:MAG TPA: hypothetical protein VHE35_35520 [Kofleriaceae bacterium]|nr:hypothetical protein [Kofleriaceae bacterium]